MKAEQLWRNLLAMRRDHEHDVVCMVGDHVFGYNPEDAWQEYAEQTGHEPLTDLEKQVALFNHVIEAGTKAMTDAR